MWFRWYATINTVLGTKVVNHSFPPQSSNGNSNSSLVSHLRHHRCCCCYCFFSFSPAIISECAMTKSVNKDFDISSITRKTFSCANVMWNEKQANFSCFSGIFLSMLISILNLKWIFVCCIWNRKYDIFFFSLCVWSVLCTFEQSTAADYNTQLERQRVLSGSFQVLGTHLSRGLLSHSMVNNHCWIKVTEWSIHVKYTRTLSQQHSTKVVSFLFGSRVLLVHSWFGCARAVAAAVFAAVSRN